MADPRVPTAHVDISSTLSLRELAQLLSARLFADVPFVGEGSGLWDEVPAVRLAQRFLDLNVELGGGAEGVFTLVIEAPDFAWERYPGTRARDVVVDITGYLAYLINRIDGLRA